MPGPSRNLRVNTSDKNGKKISDTNAKPTNTPRWLFFSDVSSIGYACCFNLFFNDRIVY